MSDSPPLPTADSPSAPAWAHDLEDGALRREMGLGAKPSDAQPLPLAHTQRLVFHGTGAEYFRIWAVNVFLTLITLGVYSAWAKVRKARWFAQNTSLDGDRFDFHGDAKRILLGRVLAVGLLLMWSFAFDFSPAAGLVVLAIFCIVGPLLFASAQRFRLANTSWRGLRFGFDVPRRKVYAVCVPLLLLWTAGTVVEALGFDGAWLAVAGVTTVLGLPWAHARLKQLQHHHAHFGDRTFNFMAAGPEFYGLYAKAIALVVVIGALLVVVMVVLAAAGLDTGVTSYSKNPIWALVISGMIGAVMWAMVWPYFAARMQQIVWSHTRLGKVRFDGHMKGWPLWRLVITQSLLTVLTLGVYWPFAVVAVARFRVQAISVESPVPLSLDVGRVPQQRGDRAAGDAAADFFGLDVGW